jgi:hypothetical protein
VPITRQNSPLGDYGSPSPVADLMDPWYGQPGEIVPRLIGKRIVFPVAEIRRFARECPCWDPHGRGRRRGSVNTDHNSVTC